MPENVGNDIDVACSPVELRTICAAQLMGRYFFERRDDFSVFLDEIFYCTNSNALFLRREEESATVGIIKLSLFLVFNVTLKRFRDIFTEKEDRLAAALSGDNEGIILEIYVVVIKSYQLANTDART